MEHEYHVTNIFSSFVIWSSFFCLDGHVRDLHCTFKQIRISIMGEVVCSGREHKADERKQQSTTFCFARGNAKSSPLTAELHLLFPLSARELDDLCITF